MRYPKFATLAGLALATLAACTDAASRLAAPGATNGSAITGPGQGPSLSKSGQGGSENGDDKDKDKENNSCQADDNRSGDDKGDGKSKYGSSSSAQSSKDGKDSKDKDGKDKDGKDKDGKDKNNKDSKESKGDENCANSGGGTGTIKKTLVDVKTSGPNGTMPHDNSWTPGGAVTIPAGQTRWLFYRIDYSLPAGTNGTITEAVSTVCATAGAGIHCSFATPGPWSVTGTGSITVQIDLTNNSACDSRTFVNTVALTPKGGTASSASASTPLTLTCGTPISLTKKLVRVWQKGAAPGSMVPDGTWTPGSNVVVIPYGDTRWLDYEVSYTLPNGVTGTLTEDSKAVCGTLGGFTLQCSFSLPPTPNGVYSWSLASGTGTVPMTIDLGGGGGGSCGDHVFTNTAKLTPSVGSPVTASTDITVRVVCPPPATLTKSLVRVWKQGAAIGTMVPDPAWTPGSSVVVVPWGETRWLDYEIAYTLPTTMTGTVTEDGGAACSSLGTFRLQCSISLPPSSTMTWSWPGLTGNGSIPVTIDLGGGGNPSCGDHQFTNYAKLVTSSGAVIPATNTITVRSVCPKP